MTQDEMTRLVQTQLDAYNEGDIDAFCACYHPEVNVHLLVTGKTTCSGIKEFREIYRGLFALNPDLHCKLKYRAVTDVAVIDHEWVTGASKYPDGLNTVAVYGFQDDKIKNVWFTR